MRGILDWIRQPDHSIALFLALMPVVALVIFVLVVGDVQYPYSDGHRINAPIAIDVSAGNFNFIDAFEPYQGHYIVFSKLQPYVMSFFHPYDPSLEVWINVFLGLLNVVLLGFLGYHISSDLFHWYLIPITVFLLSLDYGMTWLVGVYGQWFYVFTFSILSCLAVVIVKHRAWALFWGLVFVLIAMFSLGNGFVAWGMIFLMMLVCGYREWWAYLIVISGATITIAMLLFSGSVASGGDMEFSMSLQNFLIFQLVYLGRPLGEHFLGARWIVIASFVTLIGNMLLYWRVTGGFRAVGMWLPILAYAIVPGVLFALFRYETYGGMFIATVERYLPTSSVFWVGFFAILITVTGETWYKLSHRYRYGLSFANGSVALLVMVPFTINLPYGAKHMDYGIPITAVADHKLCAESYIFNRDLDCFGDIHTKPLIIDELAAWQMAGFRHLEPENRLPYVAGEPVIINSVDVWETIHIRQWWLASLPDDDVLRVTPRYEGVEPDLENIPEQTTRRVMSVEGDGLETIASFLGNEPSFWQITHPAREVTELTDWIDSAYQSGVTLKTRYGHVLTHYVRLPEDRLNGFLFGNQFELVSTAVKTDAVIDGCTTLNVQSWWQLTDKVRSPDEIRLTVAVVPEDWSTTVMSVDALIGQVTMEDWEPGNVYLDDRLLTLPCDLDMGRYMLVLGAYTFNEDTQTLVNDIAFTRSGKTEPEYRFWLDEFEIQ